MSVTAEQVIPADLPTSDELDQLWDRLADIESDVRDVLSRVFKATNVKGKQAVTDEHVASLGWFAHELRSTSGQLAASASKLSEAVFADLSWIRRMGERNSIPQFDEHGNSNYPR